MSEAEKMVTIGLLFALLAMVIAFFIGFALRKSDPRMYLTSAFFGLLMGYALYLWVPERSTITRTYNYYYYSHIDWTWIWCTPIVVIGFLAALWLKYRYGPRVDRIRELRHGRRDLIVRGNRLPARRDEDDYR